MDPDVQTPAPESSPAPTTMEVPRDSQAYAEWRMTGKLPESKPAKAQPKKQEAPATSTESAAGEEPGETAPDPASGNQQQDRTKPRHNAESRLQELLADLKRAGLSPAELKTFKREAQQQETSQQQTKATETTEKPSGPEAPKKPKVEDFKTYEDYEAARDEYFEKLSDFKAQKALSDFRMQEAQQAAARELQGKVAAAKARYGDEAESVIGSTAQSIFQDQGVHQTVKALLNDSPVLTDLLYVMGSKPEDFAEFVQTARNSPAAAIRKLVLMEHLVSEELAKGGKSAKGDETEEGDTRDSSGKFVKSTPATKLTKAPPPPKEASGRSAAPPDEVERAATAGDFASYRAAANRRDFARRQGR